MANQIIIAQITDYLLCFLTSFLCFLMLYKSILRRENKQDQNAILNERVAKLAKEQDMLLESSNERVSTFAKTQREEFRQNSGSSDTLLEKVLLVMKKAGISDMSPKTFMMDCTLGGIVFACFIVYFDFLNYISGVPIGFAVGAYLVYTFLSARAEKKKRQFLAQLPDAIDMMIRGVKAGLNINRVIKLVSIESRDPIAKEYLTISQKLDLGVKPEQVFVEAADRIDLEEFRFLVVALVLQIENGGVLGEILANLSGIVRKRLELDLKMKAMSSEARTSAIVLSALPFGFAGIMALINPGHIAEFTKPGSGQTLLKVMIVLFSLGVFFMMRATKLKI